MTRSLTARALALGLGILCSSHRAAAAQERTIVLDPVGDGIALSAGICAALAAELLIDPPEGSLEGLGSAPLPAIDAIACLPYGAGLDAASEILQYGTMLYPALFALVGERDELLPAAAACAEALAWTYAAKECAKALFPRARPYARLAAPGSDELREEALRSFPSGHAALAFCAATSFATIALETAGGEPATPWLVAGGYAAAAGVAALRVASGNHYVTDAAAGAALGSLIGWAVASLHLRDAAPSPAGAAAGGLSASLAGGPALVLRLRLD